VGEGTGEIVTDVFTDFRVVDPDSEERSICLGEGTKDNLFAFEEYDIVFHIFSFSVVNELELNKKRLASSPRRFKRKSSDPLSPWRNNQKFHGLATGTDGVIKIGEYVFHIWYQKV
jgi:hypothetical protein